MTMVYFNKTTPRYIPEKLSSSYSPQWEPEISYTVDICSQSGHTQSTHILTLNKLYSVTAMPGNNAGIYFTKVLLALRLQSSLLRISTGNSVWYFVGYFFIFRYIRKSYSAKLNNYVWYSTLVFVSWSKIIFTLSDVWKNALSWGKTHLWRKRLHIFLWMWCHKHSKIFHKFSVGWFFSRNRFILNN
jgi:hypothetical protein